MPEEVLLSGVTHLLLGRASLVLNRCVKKPGGERYLVSVPVPFLRTCNTVTVSSGMPSIWGAAIGALPLGLVLVSKVKKSCSIRYLVSSPPCEPERVLARSWTRPLLGVVPVVRPPRFEF